MATSSSSAARRDVVRPLSSVSERPCARPSCPAPARATLTFSYATREATLGRLTEERDPRGYDLCAAHAARTEPPRGWSLDDQRPEEDLQPAAPRPERDLGSEATVAVLAEALRAVPAPQQPAGPPEDATDHGDVPVPPPPDPDTAVATGPPPPPPHVLGGSSGRSPEPTAPPPAPRPVPAAEERDRRRA